MTINYCIRRRSALSVPLGSFVLPAFIALLAQSAHAGDYLSPTDERVWISLGAMHVSSTTNLQIDSSTGQPGTAINGENKFGLDKTDFEPEFRAVVRVAERHRLSFDYFMLDRSGNAVVTGTPIVFHNISFQPGAPLQTQLNLRAFGITYEYSFWHSEKLEIAGTLGVHATDISTMAKVQTQSTNIIQTQDQAGPVPAVGIDATWVASKRFYFDGRAQYLKLRVSNRDGSLGFYELNALYRLRPNVSFALGYMSVKARLTSTQPSQSGFFDFNTKGPQMFVRVSF